MNLPSAPQRLPLSWPVKLAITVLIGGGLSLCTYALFPSIFGGSPFGVAHVTTLVFWCSVLATFLCRSGSNGTRRLIAERLTLTVVASAILVSALFLFVLLGSALVDGIIH